MAHVPKTPKELREMGLMFTFGKMIDEWKNQNDLGAIEVMALLQEYQNFVIHSIILRCQEDNAEVDE